jgi:5-methylcytosine-specific restriction endonuclease McrA
MGVARSWVAAGQDGNPTRIFKNNKDAIAFELGGGKIALWPKGEAVKAIREQIFVRCNNKCEICGRWVDRTTGEMHEKHPRGELRNGQYGEYSLDNSTFLCRPCHTTGDSAQHANRRWQTARIDK